MIDQETDEVLSRYLDGDLGADEARILADRLKCDPALEETLDEMMHLRRHLRRVALQERPPEVLDRLVRPLRRAGRPRHQRWSVVALVAVAAVVVVGLIVVSEVGRTGWAPWNARSGDEEIFRLSNLPSRDPDAPLGAIETLMAEADAEPDLVEPEVFEVVGPLEEAPEDQQWVLLLDAGNIVIPLAGTVEKEGRIVVLTLEGGRVTSCRMPDGIEIDTEARDICSQTLSTENVELANGRYQGLVTRWADVNSPDSEFLDGRNADLQ